MIASPLPRVALVVAMFAMSAGLALAAESESDFILKRDPTTSAIPPSSLFAPEFKFLFGGPARWPSKVLHWGYNAAGAPASFSDAASTVQKISAAAAKWSAVCDIHFVYDGATAVAPYDGVAPQPDFVNVVGWRNLGAGIAGTTYGWYGVLGNGSHVLVDTDILFDIGYIITEARMDRTASHEWGHAIGIAHSNISDELMSGTPDSPYSSQVNPQDDDIRACRCLYGAAAGQPAAYACSLPSKVDFGAQTTGVDSAPVEVAITNDPTATLPLTVDGTIFTSGDFRVGATTCAAGIALAPGAGCTIDFIARPLAAGVRSAEAMILTSDGPYRLPLTAVGASGPPPPNFQGLWWNSPAASESGWGLNVAHQGDTIFASWFTYDLAGRGWWLVMTAQKTGVNTYKGTLYETRGPAFDAVPFDPAMVTLSAVGNGTLTFADANNGTFAYTVNGVPQAKSITREVFGPLPVCTFGSLSNLAFASNFQDLWWKAPASTESGWGINLNHQGDTIFATWFTYDHDGTPLWLVVTAPKVSAGKFVGDLYRTTGPPFNAIPFDPSKVVATKVGTATFTFTNGNAATFAFTVQLAGMAAPVTQSKAITREIFAPPGTACQ